MWLFKTQRNKTTLYNANLKTIKVVDKAKIPWCSLLNAITSIYFTPVTGHADAFGNDQR